MSPGAAALVVAVLVCGAPPAESPAMNWSCCGWRGWVWAAAQQADVCIGFASLRARTDDAWLPTTLARRAPLACCLTWPFLPLRGFLGCRGLRWQQKQQNVMSDSSSAAAPAQARKKNRPAQG